MIQLWKMISSGRFLLFSLLCACALSSAGKVYRDFAEFYVASRQVHEVGNEFDLTGTVILPCSRQDKTFEVSDGTNALTFVDGVLWPRQLLTAGDRVHVRGRINHSFNFTCDQIEIVGKALKDADYTWGFVPYTDPGARLTFSIRDELKRVEEATGKRPAAIFMQNHGLIAHSDDPDECLRIHTDVNARIAKAFGIELGAFPAVSVKELEGGLVEAVSPYLSEELKSGEYDEEFFLTKPLYPDQLVFLTGAFSMGKAAPAEGCCVADAETGSLIFNMPAAKAQVIAETLTAVVFICRLIKKNGKTLSTMGEAAKAFIANWESEKYRKSLAGKK